MSMPDREEHSNVVGIEEVLLQTYQELLTLDEKLHMMRDHLKARMYALRAFENKGLMANVRDVEERLESGQTDDAMQAEKFVRRARELAEQS